MTFQDACTKYALLTIPGWLLAEEAAFLYETTRKMPGAQVVEIGSWLGRSTAVFLAAGAAVVCVDPFTGEGTDKHQVVRDFGLTYHLLVRHAENMRARALPLPLYYPVKSESAAWPDAWKMDMVFVDGNHSAHDVAADVRIWRARLKAGGVLLGHDYHTASVRQGLLTAGVSAVTNPVGSIWVGQ